MLSRFTIFGRGDTDNVNTSSSVEATRPKPVLKVLTDKDHYRPGDSVNLTLEISYPGECSQGLESSLLIERLGFEVRGIEKVDAQWFYTQKPLPGSKQKRGEYIFMDCSVYSLINNQRLYCGTTKTYAVRFLLPDFIPPSYRGATIRYFYYAKSVLSGRWMLQQNTDCCTKSSSPKSSREIIKVEDRVPLQIWVTEKGNGLLLEGTNDGIVPTTTMRLDLQWREVSENSEWVKAYDCGTEVEEYESSRDEISSASSSNFTLDNMQKMLDASLSIQSSHTRPSSKGILFVDGDQKNHREASPLSHFSIVEAMHENSTSESYIRAKTYNIKVDDQVLLRFSPIKPDPTFYFGDAVGGVLTFAHGHTARRCIEVSITLETLESISSHSVHSSRKSSPTITKVQCDHFEVVSDLLQTSFLFSIPVDGPMTFSTRNVSVRWALRFEFYITPKNVDWTRYEHPLLIQGRDKTEWIFPIMVHSPPTASTVANPQRRTSVLESFPLK